MSCNRRHFTAGFSNQARDEGTATSTLKIGANAILGFSNQARDEGTATWKRYQSGYERILVSAIRPVMRVLQQLQAYAGIIGSQSFSNQARDEGTATAMHTRKQQKPTMFQQLGP